MTTTPNVHATKAAAGRHVRQPETWLKILGKAGYAARSVVYVVIGFIALTAAFGGENQATGSRGALQQMLQEPFGVLILILVAIGLVGYAIWRFVQAIKDTDHHGTDGKGMVIRIGLLISGISHILLALYAAYLIYYGQQSSGGESSTQEWTAWLMAKQWGVYMVGFVGLCVIGAGIAQMYKGATAGFEKYMDMDRDVDRWARPTGMVGLIARGITFCIIGVLFLVAAYQADPSEAQGLGGALQALQSQPYGPWLLAAVALGLLAFAAYSLLEAFYRRIEMDDSHDRPNTPERIKTA